MSQIDEYECYGAACIEMYRRLCEGTLFTVAPLTAWTPTQSNSPV